ncbi:hypothetical protein K435DRAFT_809368 [Dendrothele bispora CBS 962.96]|uniref:Uncharacterized protein n=1 Tax=Dendrothele bispora (strain CBS 962.96) TaxID=1314807 RepID=A0A4S8KYV0_DENBC|nr:hypothetical protein K435DRAFT_809368 [Dendrothele bispora CBS 962.96]
MKIRTRTGSSPHHKVVFLLNVSHYSVQEGVKTYCLFASVDQLSRLATSITSVVTGWGLSALAVLTTTDIGNMASAFRDGLSPKTMNTMEYRRIQAKLFHIRTCLSHFALFNPTRSEIKKCLSHHRPSSASILEKTLGNLFQIHSELLLLRQHVEMSLWRLADSKLDDATIVLRDIIKDAVERKISFNGSLSPQNFRRLGPTQWLDDEIINYFVERWCSQSQTTLGFTTFFAETFLFQNSGPYCTVARTIFNRSQAEKLDRWYSKRLIAVSCLL